MQRNSLGSGMLDRAERAWNGLFGLRLILDVVLLMTAVLAPARKSVAQTVRVDGSRHRPGILGRPTAALVPPTKAAISLLLLSLTHFNSTGGIRCTKAIPRSNWLDMARSETISFPQS